MNRRIERELTLLESYRPLSNYYNISQDDNVEFIIDFTNISKNNKYGIILDISYKKQNSYFSFPILPPEINDLIYSFNSYSIKLKCVLQHPNDYPFKSVKWGLLNIINNINKTNLNEYYKTIIREHNTINERQWQPSHSIHHDILNFITKINDFDSLIKCV